TRLPCCCLINRAVGNDDTIVAFRIFNGDQTIEHIVQHLPRIALARIADAAAARQAKLNRVAWWHGLPSLGADRPARAQANRSRAAGLPAGAAARRAFHALEIAEQCDRACARAA